MESVISHIRDSALVTHPMLNSIHSLPGSILTSLATHHPSTTHTRALIIPPLPLVRRYTMGEQSHAAPSPRSFRRYTMGKQCHAAPGSRSFRFRILSFS